MAFLGATCNFGGHNTSMYSAESQTGFSQETIQSLLSDFKLQEECLYNFINSADRQHANAENDDALSSNLSLYDDLLLNQSSSGVEAASMFDTEFTESRDQSMSEDTDKDGSENVSLSTTSSSSSSSSDLFLRFDNDEEQQRLHQLQSDIFGLFHSPEFPTHRELGGRESRYDDNGEDDDAEDIALNFWMPTNQRESTVGIDIVFKEPRLSGVSRESVKQRSSLKVVGASSLKKRKKSKQRRLLVGCGGFLSVNNNASNQSNRDDGCSAHQSKARIKVRTWYFEDVVTNDFVTPLFRVPTRFQFEALLNQSLASLPTQMSASSSTFNSYERFLHHLSSPSCLSVPHHHHDALMMHPSSLPVFTFSPSTNPVPSTFSLTHTNGVNLIRRDLQCQQLRLFKDRLSYPEAILPSVLCNRQLFGNAFNQNMLSNILCQIMRHQCLLPQLPIPRGLNPVPNQSFVFRGKRRLPMQHFILQLRSSSHRHDCGQEGESQDEAESICHLRPNKRRRLCLQSLTPKSLEERFSRTVIHRS